MGPAIDCMPMAGVEWMEWLSVAGVGTGTGKDIDITGAASGTEDSGSGTGSASNEAALLLPAFAYQKIMLSLSYDRIVYEYYP